jgi:succinyl-CoA synthetase alpha subunit
LAIITNHKTHVIVQGITGREGRFHTELMLKYGTKIVAGITPGKDGVTVGPIRVYNSVRKAVTQYPEANTSILFVPAPYVADAVYESIDAGIKTIIVISENVPVHDSLKMIAYGEPKGVKIIGPNCPGIISPPDCKVGIMPSHFFKEGFIGIVSRSGTLTYEVAASLSKEGFGQSSVIGIGGDPVTGLNFTDAVLMFNEDPKTKAIAVLGEIGGNSEERLAEYLKKQGMKKPIIGYVAGRVAPPGKRMGHAGAIINMGEGDADRKRNSFEEAGILVADIPSQIPFLVKSIL